MKPRTLTWGAKACLGLMGLIMGAASLMGYLLYRLADWIEGGAIKRSLEAYNAHANKPNHPNQSGYL